MTYQQKPIAALTAALLLASLLFACSPLQTPPSTPTPEPTAVPTATPLPVLSDAMLQNGAYLTPQYSRSVTLVDGKSETGSGESYFLASLLPQQARGDLNGDGLEDVALLLAENGGGSGVFVSLIGVLNQNGLPVQTGALLIDDRPQINSLEIRDGRILLDAVIHGINDPMVSPTLQVRETIELAGGAFALVRFTSSMAGGVERSINITAPVNGAGVSGSVQVQGNMPIAPFENNLLLRIVDENGAALREGPFAVQAADLGAPGTFDNPVDLGGIAPGSRVRIELVEQSMADGSTIALDSVWVTVQ